METIVRLQDEQMFSRSGGDEKLRHVLQLWRTKTLALLILVKLALLLL